MWFTNLTLYRLIAPFGESPEWLARRLATKRERPCGPLENFSIGFSPPLGRLAEHLIHAAGGCILFTQCKQTRMLPAAVVREVLDERIAEIETTEQRTVRGKEKRRMKDDITFELLPKAFTKNQYVSAFLWPDAGWLAIDTSSPGRAEDFVALLREAAPGIKLEQWVSNVPPMVMSQWLQRGHAGDPFTFGDECELREPGEDGAIWRAQKEDLACAEVRNHLKAGKEVHRLGLEYGAGLQFVLCSDMLMRRVRYAGVDELDSDDELDELARFDANYVFMIETLKPLLGELAKLFGTDAAEPRAVPESFVTPVEGADAPEPLVESGSIAPPVEGGPTGDGPSDELSTDAPSTDDPPFDADDPPFDPDP